MPTGLRRARTTPAGSMEVNPAFYDDEPESEGLLGPAIPSRESVAASDDIDIALARETIAAGLNGRSLMRARLPLIRRVPLFEALSEPELEALAAALTSIEFEPGEAVLRQGDLGDAMYFIEGGAASAEIDGKSVRDYTPGDYFGELALMLNQPRSASVVARGSDKLHLLALPQVRTPAAARMPASAPAPSPEWPPPSPRSLPTRGLPGTVAALIAISPLTCHGVFVRPPQRDFERLVLAYCPSQMMLSTRYKATGSKMMQLQRLLKNDAVLAVGKLKFTSEREMLDPYVAQGKDKEARWGKFVVVGMAGDSTVIMLRREEGCDKWGGGESSPWEPLCDDSRACTV